MSVRFNPYSPIQDSPLARAIRQPLTPEPHQVQVVNDPLAMSMELAEELAFMRHGTHRSTESENDEKNARFADASEEAARRALQLVAQQVRRVELEEQAQAIADYVIKTKSFLADKALLESILAPYSKGSSAHNLAILQTLLSRQDPRLEAQGLTPALVSDYAAYRHQEIAAFVHVAQTIAQYQDQLSMSSQELMGSYEQAIVHTDCVLGAWRELGRRLGLEHCNRWKEFIQKSVVADLYAQDIGADKVHLQFILQELHSLRILQTLQDFLGQLKEKRLAHASVQTGEILQTTLDFSCEPVAHLPAIDSWVFDQNLDQRILFFQDFRHVCKEIPPDAFASEHHVSDVKVVIQTQIDQLVYSQTE